MTTRTLTVLAALGAAGVGGVLFAFSAFVMAGLNRLPPERGAAAMQSINVTAVRPVFMVALFGTAALCVYLGVRAVLTWGDRQAGLLLAASVVYLAGVIALTAAYHVPLNDKLATLDVTSPGAAAQWSDYVTNWTRWNHLRAASGVGAGALFIMALL